MFYLDSFDVDSPTSYSKLKLLSSATNLCIGDDLVDMVKVVG